MGPNFRKNLNFLATLVGLRTKSYSSWFLIKLHVLAIKPSESDKVCRRSSILKNAAEHIIIKNFCIEEGKGKITFIVLSWAHLFCFLLTTTTLILWPSSGLEFSPGPRLDWVLFFSNIYLLLLPALSHSKHDYVLPYLARSSKSLWNIQLLSSGRASNCSAWDYTLLA